MQISKQISYSTYGLSAVMIIMMVLVWKGATKNQEEIQANSELMVSNGIALEGLYNTGLFIHKWFLNPDPIINIEKKIENLELYAEQLTLPDSKNIIDRFKAIQNRYLDFYKTEGKVLNDENLEKLRAITFYSADYIDQLKKSNRNWQQKNFEAVAERIGFTRIAAVSFLLFFLVLILFLGLLMSNRFSKSINQLKAAASAIEKGTFTKNISIKGNNEFQKLGESFNQLASNVKHSNIIKDQNNQLEKLNRELNLKNDSLDSFVYRVSHDLKAPLINLISLLNIVKKGVAKYDDHKLNRPLDFMQKNSEKLSQTIHDLLEVSKIERDLKKEKRKVSIQDVLNEIIEENIESIETSKTTIDINLDVQDVHFAKTNLKSVLSNLITNGIKYRKPSGRNTIIIHSTNVDGAVKIQIIDNGIGIDLQKHRGKLFGIFNRFHNHVEGSGVGLYIVKKIMEENGGIIVVDSEIDKGTAFTLTFPRYNQDKESALNKAIVSEVV